MIITMFLELAKQQRERPEKFRPEQGFEPRPLRWRCTAQQVQSSGQLGVRRYVEFFRPFSLLFKQR